MNRFFGFAVSVVVVGLLFSCTSDSVVGQSGVIYGIPVTYEGETYQTVVIGSQTWMAKNLNYNASGSKCYGDVDSNCNTYGRLYDWLTAMGFASSCNSSTCSSQIQSPHRGICPIGWHIPSQADWNTLSSYVQSNSGCSSCDAELLKSTSSWISLEGNGTDQYGFSALPGGYGNSDGSFDYVGRIGRWWSTSGIGSSYAYNRSMHYDIDYASWNYYKSSLFSVRCVQD